MRFIDKKKSVVLLVILSVFFTILFLLENACRDFHFHKGAICESVRMLYVLPEAFWMSLLGFTSTLIPVLFTLRLKPSVFEAWKRFAVYAIPVVLMLVGWIMWKDAHSGGGFMSISIAPLLIGFIYLVYSVISLVIIIRSWLRSRK